MAALTGKVAWVTGAGSGIGQAAAIALAKEGATVVLTGRRKEPLEETAATIKQAGGKAVVKPADLMKAAAVGHVAKDIDQKFGRCDILVNNAGLNIPDRKWSELDVGRRGMVIDGNLSSAFYCSTAVLPMMRKRKDGVLIHTSSMAGRNPSPLERRGLFRGQARRGGDEPHHQHGGVRQRHPLLRRVPGRGGHADPRQAADPHHQGGARPHGPVGGCRRPDPLCRLPAGAHRDQRGHDQPDLEPRLCRRPAARGSEKKAKAGKK